MDEVKVLVVVCLDCGQTYTKKTVEDKGDHRCPTLNEAKPLGGDLLG